MGGCVLQDWSLCPPPMREVMVVTAYDLATQQYITVSGRVEDGSLFFFDNDTKLIEDGYVPVPKEQLGREKPLPEVVTRTAVQGDQVWISAWGNIGDSNFGVEAYPVWGDDVSQEFLYLTPDNLYDGYYSCPDEILFGMRRITLGQIDHPTLDRIVKDADGVDKLVHEIQLNPINALLTIQVEGLPPSKAEDYYFKICKQNNGYNYEGAPFSGDELRDVRETGVFDSRGFLVTEVPYNLVPSLDPTPETTDPITPQEMNPDLGVVLHVFQLSSTRADEGTDLTGQVSKVDYGDGDYIGLYSGQTTNVRIRFVNGGVADGKIEVTVKVTPWGEVYQWAEWK